MQNEWHLLQAVVLAQCSVEQGQLAQLIASQVVGRLGQVDALLHDLAYLGTRLGHTLHRRSCHIGVQWFIFARQRLAVFTADFVLFDRTLAANDYFASGLLSFNF